MKKERIMKVLMDLVNLSEESNAKLQSEEARILNSIVTTTLKVVTKEVANLEDDDEPEVKPLQDENEN